MAASESCFLVSKKALRGGFDERYKNYLFVHDFFLRQALNDVHAVLNAKSGIQHYFIELHERLKTWEEDKEVFVMNNFPYLRLLWLLNEKNLTIEASDRQLAEKGSLQNSVLNRTGR